MVTRLNKTGDWLFAGVVSKDAVYKTVGEKGTPLCEFSVNCGKKDNGDTIFVNCKAWRNLAGVFSELLKGDAFAGIGHEKTREYNGRTYTDIELEWGNSPMICGSVPETTPELPANSPFTPVSDDEDDYPEFLRDGYSEPCL